MDGLERVRFSWNQSFGFGNVEQPGFLVLRVACHRMCAEVGPEVGPDPAVPLSWSLGPTLSLDLGRVMGFGGSIMGAVGPLPLGLIRSYI
jgi:hypothetical protein